MANKSETSIYITHSPKIKMKMRMKTSMHLRLQPCTQNLMIFKKDDMSMNDQNYEPSLGLQESVLIHIIQNIVSAGQNRLEKTPLQIESSLVVGNQGQCISNTPPQQPFLCQRWTKNGLNIIRLVSKFMRQLKTHTHIFQYKMLNEKVLSLLDDKASNAKNAIEMKKIFFKQKLKNSFSDLNYFSFLLDFIPSLQPDNPLLIIYKIILFLFLLANILYFPIEIFYFNNLDLQQEKWSFYFETIPVIFCLFDLGIGFCISFYEEGILYSNKTKIITNNLKNNFTLDALCIVSIFHLHPGLQYLKLLRIAKLRKTLNSIEEVIYFQQKIQGYWELVKQVFFIIYFWHFFSCLWHMIGVIGNENQQKNWIQVKELNDSIFLEQYSYSLYFIVITTLTIGFGDIIPYNVYETLFTIVIAFAGCCVLGYTINNIGEIFKNINEGEIKFKKQMKNIQQYLKDYSINQKLSLQIRKYFQYHLRAQIENTHDGQEILNQLNKSLKQQMQIDLYRKYLMKIHAIKDYSSEDTIEKLCQFVQIEHFAPEAQIIEQQQNPSKLFYVLEGELKMYITLGNKQDVSVVETLASDSVIGQWEFLLQNPYLYSVKATKYSKLMSININDYIRVLSKNKDDYEKFSQMKDENIFKIKQKGRKCFFCEWIHYFDKCPLVFFIPDKDKILISHLQSEHHQRQIFKRQKKEKTDSLISISNNRQAALEFILQSDNDLPVQLLRDLGFTKNDSVFSNTGIFEDLELKGGGSEFEPNSSSLLQQPASFAKAPFFRINDSYESVLNFKSNTNELNRQNSQNRSRRLSELVQSQLKLLTNSRADLRVRDQKKFEVVNQSHQTRSNLNALQTQNSNVQGSQEETEKFADKIKTELAIAIQQSQLQAANAQINYDIDKYYIFKNYFKEGNFNTVVKNLIGQQNQFRLQSTKKQSILNSGRYHFSNRMMKSLKKKKQLEGFTLD